MPYLKTIEQISKDLKIPVANVRYAIKSRSIAHTSMVGHIYLYGPGQVVKIIKALAGIQERRKHEY